MNLAIKLIFDIIKGKTRSVDACFEAASVLLNIIQAGGESR